VLNTSLWISKARELHRQSVLACSSAATPGPASAKRGAHACYADNILKSSVSPVWTRSFLYSRTLPRRASLGPATGRPFVSARPLRALRDLVAKVVCVRIQWDRAVFVGCLRLHIFGPTRSGDRADREQGHRHVQSNAGGHERTIRAEMDMSIRRVTTDLQAVGPFGFDEAAAGQETSSASSLYEMVDDEGRKRSSSSLEPMPSSVRSACPSRPHPP